MTYLRYRYCDANRVSLRILELECTSICPGEIKIGHEDVGHHEAGPVSLSPEEARELAAWLLARTGRRDLAELALQEPRGYHFLPGPDGEKRLAQMVESSGASGTQDVLRRALAIYGELLRQRVEEGRVLHLIGPDGLRLQLPIWPGDDFESRTPPSIGELLKTHPDLRKDWGDDL